eukprot:Em0128g7a
MDVLRLVSTKLDEHQYIILDADQSVVMDISGHLFHSRDIVNLLASGKVPVSVSQYLAGGSLTALVKDKPRFSSRHSPHLQKSKASEFFAPFQFGVACPAGAEKVIHGLRHCIEEHWEEEDFVVLKIDMCNAFNLVSRQALLDECALHFPDLLPWASWCYGQQPLLQHPLGTVTSELVSAIAMDEDASRLLFHAGYQDDGVVAGPKQSVLRALYIIQELGPPLGLVINPSKCLSTASQLEEVGSVDPQVALLLLRTCGAFCKLDALGKIHTPSLVAEGFKYFDNDVRHCFALCTGVDTSDDAWEQAQLSLSRGGFRASSSVKAFTSLLYCFCVQVRVVISSSATSSCSPLMILYHCIPPSKAIYFESLTNTPSSQKHFRERLKMQCLGSYLAFRGSFSGLNLHLEPAEFQAAIQWWLGIGGLPPVQCVHNCPHSLDPLGHHALPASMSPVDRACIGVQVEAGSGLGRDEHHTRPADVLAANWMLGKPAAFDFAVTSPLISIVVETYGCWGTEAKWALSQLASRLAMRLNCPKSTATASLYGRLSITLVRANVRALLSRVITLDGY